MSNRIMFAAYAVSAWVCSAWAQDECSNRIGQGVWTPEPGFTVPMIPSLPCTRIYACGEEIDVTADNCHPVYTYPPRKRAVAGECSAGGGPADSCNECRTIPPSDPCEWIWKRM
jgi:hypothetical protein